MEEGVGKGIRSWPRASRYSLTSFRILPTPFLLLLVRRIHHSTYFAHPAMSSTRLLGHPSLPAPVVHAGFSAHQSKSHVLAGVQDAYWSDDDAVSHSQTLASNHLSPPIIAG